MSLLPDHATFRDLLSRDHARLDAMLSSALELAHRNMNPLLHEQWAAYEDNLLIHLDAEEMFLLPGLAKHDLSLATRIREDHTKIRAQLAEVGVGLELHIVREQQMIELAHQLREHAEMEEEPLYLWAETAISASHFAAVHRRLCASWQSAASLIVPVRHGKADSGAAAMQATLESK